MHAGNDVPELHDLLAASRCCRAEKPAGNRACQSRRADGLRPAERRQERGDTSPDDHAVERARILDAVVHDVSAGIDRIEVEREPVAVDVCVETFGPVSRVPAVARLAVADPGQPAVAARPEGRDVERIAGTDVDDGENARSMLAVELAEGLDEERLGVAHGYSDRTGRSDLHP